MTLMVVFDHDIDHDLEEAVRYSRESCFSEMWTCVYSYLEEKMVVTQRPHDT